MALKFKLVEMLRQIRAHGATEAQVDAYLTEWNSAIEHSGQPLPCPICFLKGEIQRINSIDDESGVSKVRCVCCRQYFVFDSTE